MKRTAVLDSAGISHNVNFTFGKEGNPLYIEGPHDNVERILRTLHTALDPEDFNAAAGRFIDDEDEVPKDFAG